MKDKNWTLSDLRFIAKKREFWAVLFAAALVGGMIGYWLG